MDLVAIGTIAFDTVETPTGKAEKQLGGTAVYLCLAASYFCKVGIVAATGAVGLVYVASILLSFFGIQIPFIHSAGPIGIGFSVVVVGIAAFNLLLDFDMIDRMSAQRAPKQMEWYAAFALLMTLVWLYIEILRLLRKLNERD